MTDRYVVDYILSKTNEVVSFVRSNVYRSRVLSYKSIRRHCAAHIVHPKTERSETRLDQRDQLNGKHKTNKNR